MIRAALFALLLTGCVTTPVAVECRVDPPPASLLTVPPPLPPVPADMPRK